MVPATERFPFLAPTNQQWHEQAERERKLVRDWLLGLMQQSPIKPATNDVLRQIAIDKSAASKRSFDTGWIWAIEDSGNHHRYDPRPRAMQGRPD